MPAIRTTWRAFAFDPAVPIDRLELVLESDDPRTRALVEQAASAHGVELELAMATFTCPRCQRTSYNSNDAREGYCGSCKTWTTEAGRPDDTRRPFE